VIVGVVSVVVLMVLAAGVVLVVNWLKMPQVDTKTALNDARDKAFSGKKEEAIAVLEQQLKQAKSNEDKASLHMQMGAIYEGKSDFKPALEAYRQAGALMPSFGTNDAIARAAEKSGDKALALEYYQKNLQLIKDGKVPYRGSSDRRVTEEAIVRLGGTL
jgi:tetratricopeptide (TPR) repeat protein